MVDRFVRVIVVVGTLASVQKAAAQDFQLVQPGNGTPFADCVTAGPNDRINSFPRGDDQKLATRITTGRNGRCETTVLIFGSDDVQVLAPDHGLPDAPLVLTGNSFLNDGICNDEVVPAGDDVVHVGAGASEPHRIAIRAGANSVVDTTPLLDDQLSGVICPGPNFLIDTVRDPRDTLPVNGPLCVLCGAPASNACIEPGDDGTLETEPSGDDVKAPFLSTGNDGIAQTTAAGDDVQVILPGQGFLDTVCVTTGPDGIAQTSLCGNHDLDLGEDCDDGNRVSDDGCSDLCRPEFCGDGIYQPHAGGDEECDDGNARNADACLVGCRASRCGDLMLRRGVEDCDPPDGITCDSACQAIILASCGNGTVDPGEGCDDGNRSDRDDCPNNCIPARYGDGFEHSKGTPPFEECDDGNTTPGDGCSPTCTRECGNGVIGGACTEGNVGAVCHTDVDCDTLPSNGRCVGEECDPGASGLCVPGPSMCSDVCRIARCGNGERECDEDCDRGPLNGQPSGGCTVTCRRTTGLLHGLHDCFTLWTLENPPGGAGNATQRCRDGAACDFDSVPGQCTFRVGLCLNRTGVTDCTPGNLTTFELLHLDITQARQAAVAEALTAAVHDLGPSVASVPDRCRQGLRGKTCSIPADGECDTSFGSDDGRCDVGTGVKFSPPLTLANQVSPCTPESDVVVAAGTHLVLKSRVRQQGGARDADTLRLFCDS